MDSNNNLRGNPRVSRSRSSNSLPAIVRSSIIGFMREQEERRSRATTRRYSTADEFSSTDFFDSEAGLLRASKEVNGKYRSILHGTIALGPGIIKLSITVFLNFCLATLMIMQHPLIEAKFGFLVPYVGYSLWILAFQFLFCTATTDPGIMPRNIGYADHCLKYPRNLVRELGLPPHYCGKCAVRRPPRTYHCDTCNICIRHQDMHVGMLGTCVGERNFRYYYCLNVALVGLSSYLITINTLILKAANDRRVNGIQFWNINSILALNLLCCGMTILLLPQTGIIIFLYRFYLVSKDRTVREEFRAIMLGRDYSERDRTRFREKPFFYTFLEHLVPVPYTRSYFSRGNQIVIGPRGRGPPSVLEDFQHWTFNGIALSEQHLLDDLPRFRRHKEKSSLQSQKEKALNSDLFGNAVSAKRKAFYSMPMLVDGEVGRLPSTRQRFLKRSRPTEVLASKLVLYQELLETPKAEADRQFQRQRYTGSLSVGDMPRATWNQNMENEIVYQARASQIQRVVELVQRRDRLGLIALSRRINVGALMGLQELDPDNLQIIELNNNGIPVLGGRRASRVVRQQMNRGGVGISQMVAAGLMSRLDGSIVREMVPPAPPAIPQPPPPVYPQLRAPASDREIHLQFGHASTAAPRLFRNTVFRNHPTLNDLRGHFMRQSAIPAPPPPPRPRNSRPTNRRAETLRGLDMSTRAAWDNSVLVVVGNEQRSPARPAGHRPRSSSSSRRERERVRAENRDREDDI